MKNNVHILELKQLRDKIPHGGLIETHVGGAEWHRVVTECGIAMIRGLLKREEIAVSDNIASAGTIYPMHTHDACESLVVYKGKMNLHIGDKLVQIDCSSKPYYFDAREEHWAEFPVDTEFIATTRPADKGWPEGG